MTEAAKKDPDQLVIATVGLCGVGKSEASRFLTEQLRTETVYFGGFVANEIRSRGLPVTPEMEKLVKEELREHHGMDVVAQMAVEPIRLVLSRRNSVVIDGLYSLAEYEFLKANFGEGLVVVAIHAGKESRYERLAVRPERPFTRHEVDARDRHEILRLDKAPPIVLADHHIVNDGPIERLHEALGAVLNSLI